MNIAFHYHAIKAMAVCAGFDDQEAQVIAEYSQFIDDYTVKDTMHTTWAPEIAVQMGVTEKKSKNRYRTKAVTTGFFSTADMIRLLSPTQRNRIVVPFHFILAKQMTSENFADTVVPAYISDEQIVSRMLRTVCSKIYESPANRNEYLMPLGMILHVYADTYAHQRFSGHRQTSNDYRIQRAVRRYRDIPPQDETKKYSKEGLIPYSKLPSIGHTTAGHLPDDTYLDFKIKNPDTGDIYERDNYEMLTNFSATVFDILKECNHKLTPSFETILPNMREGLLADNDHMEALDAGWTEAFRSKNIRFHYDKVELLHRLIPSLSSYVEGEEVLAEPYPADEYAAVLDRMLSGDPDHPEGTSYGATVTSDFFKFTIQAYAMRSAAIGPQYL